MHPRFQKIYEYIKKKIGVAKNFFLSETGCMGRWRASKSRVAWTLAKEGTMIEVGYGYGSGVERKSQREAALF